VVLRIKVRYEEPTAFVERFAPYVGRAGLFLRSKVPKPVGTEVRFELRLADDRPVLVGMGVVRWAREPDPERPMQPAGMAIEFTRVTKESRGVILQMLELRRKLGLADGPRGLPTPPDDDVVLTPASPAPATGPGAPVPVAPYPPAPSAAIAVPAPYPPAPSAITPLAPHVERAKRPSPAELVASLARAGAPPLADAFGDEEIAEADLSSAISRARKLAGSDVERELAQLLDDAAAPMEVTIDEASTKLASLLGTSPVARRRSDDSVRTQQRPVFAPPPKIATAITADLVAAAAAAASPAAAPTPDPSDTTRVVDLQGLAATTEAAADVPTRVMQLDALIAETRDRDGEERTQVRIPVGDEDRTRVLATRPFQRAASHDDVDDTLDFDRRPPAEARTDQTDERPHFGDVAEPETNVRHRESPPARPPATAPPPSRKASRTTPPPLPPPARRRPTTQAPPPPPAPPPSSRAATIVDDRDDDDIPDLRPRSGGPTTSSGSIDLTDLVDELARETAPPATVHSREGELGRRLGGEALDADGLMAGLDSFERRPTPTRPSRPALGGIDDSYPDLASFADPPSTLPQRADATRDRARDAAREEDRSNRARSAPARLGPGVRAGTPSREVSAGADGSAGDDDGVEIEIELDD